MQTFFIFSCSLVDRMDETLIVRSVVRSPANVHVSKHPKKYPQTALHLSIYPNTTTSLKYAQLNIIKRTPHSTVA